jgi:hypothetical protein
VPNVYRFEALKAMHSLTGNGKYLAEAENLKKSIRQNFIKDGRFVDSLDSDHTAIHTAMFALYSGLAEADEIDRMKDVISERGMACSVYCAQFLVETCFANGMAEHAIDLMRSDSDRSWFNMLRAGATMSMESWGGKKNQDWSHAWGAAPANLIPRCLCGIRPLKPGFSEFIVAPEPGDLEFFSYLQPTVYGGVKVEYHRGSGVKVTLPDGTEHCFAGGMQKFKLG